MLITALIIFFCLFIIFGLVAMAGDIVNMTNEYSEKLIWYVIGSLGLFSITGTIIVVMLVNHIPIP